ncbi:ABC transporter substrate-binding protein [Roseomonas soli]|uniref:ABC transporter substrate-binding protein n=2 Tax=Neoroseomonas soli TaxID=1081025 RepID=A0A9X9WX31_9PROT|nr:ABC transporter substrate-binding protein [Neoroseomonas soli]
MSFSRRSLMGAAAVASGWPAMSRAQSARPKIKLGIITDLSGPNKDNSEPSMACCRQAIQDFGAAERGIDVEVLIADHQNKADVASGIARRWFDEDGVDCLVDVSTSTTALAVNSVARAKNKVMLVVGAATSDLTGAQCSPNTIHWSYDTYMLAKASTAAVMGQNGRNWFFLGADYAFGHAMVRDASAFVTTGGGRVSGRIFYPFPATTDFSAYLLQAQSSGAQVLALSQTGADTYNTIKQMREFGVDRRMRPVTLLMYATEVHRLGLDAMKGVLLVESFYWDANQRTRAFMDRIRSKTAHNWPSSASAGVYSDTLHYLKAAADMGVAAAKADGAATVARMKAMPTDDDVHGVGRIRPDGRKIHDAYLLEVKAPAESRGGWDLMKVAATIPAEEAFRPLAGGGCALVP